MKHFLECATQQWDIVQQNVTKTSPHRILPVIERVALTLAGIALLQSGNIRAPQRVPITLLGLGSITAGTLGYHAALDYLTTRTNTLIMVSRTINRPVADLFARWQELELLPAYMQDLDSVNTIDARISVWVIKTPFGLPLTWQAETTEVVPDHSISWQARMEYIATHAGTVRFTAAPGGRGCEVTITLHYQLISGLLPALAQPFLRTLLEEWISYNLLQLKQRLETGQHTTTQGQPSARQPETPISDPAQLSATTRTLDDVNRDSNDSFPASDPPAWMAGNKGQS